MNEPLSIIRIEALREALLNDNPFPFVVIENFLRPEYAVDVAQDFPAIKSRGSFPLSEVSGGATFQRLVDELNSAELKAAIAKKFHVNLDDRSTMITVRLHARSRDGGI